MKYRSPQTVQKKSANMLSVPLPSPAGLYICKKEKSCWHKVGPKSNGRDLSVQAWPPEGVKSQGNRSGVADVVSFGSAQFSLYSLCFAAMFVASSEKLVVARLQPPSVGRSMPLSLSCFSPDHLSRVAPVRSNVTPCKVSSSPSASSPSI